jgi:hypothetical protein
VNLDHPPILMNTISKCLLLAVVLAVVSFDISAQTTTPYQPVCDIDQAVKLVGTVSLSLGIERVVTPTMSCLLSLWRDDKGGNTRFIVSNAFLSIMEQNPQLFFSIMSQEPKIFTEWSSNLNNLSFTWPFDPPCGLEPKRKRLILALQHAELGPGKPNDLREAVAKRLSTIRCRQIQ